MRTTEFWGEALPSARSNILSEKKQLEKITPYGEECHYWRSLRVPIYQPL